jgi:nucleoid DNA-binding protein
MQELIQELVQKAGLTPEQASKSIQVITEYIKGQLPPMMQGVVENFLGGQQANPQDKVGE